MKLAPEFFFSEFLISKNLLQSQLSIIDTPVTDQQKAIVSGKVDAVAAIDPTAYNIKIALGEKGIDWPAQETQDVSWLVISTDQYLKMHSEAAQRFLKSLLLAENFVKGNPEKSKEIMENRFAFSQNFIKQNWPKHKFNVILSQFLITILENEARWTIQNKLTINTKIPNYLNFIYFDALTKIKPEAVTIIH